MNDCPDHLEGAHILLKLLSRFLMILADFCHFSSFPAAYLISWARLQSKNLHLIE
jgi:hypothetical protein